jgi:hypothetical protein
MTNGESKLRTALASAALLLTLFQCWYVYLPDIEAVTFHHCRLNAQLDCYKSLSLHGAEMTPFGIPVFPALAAIYFWMAALLACSRTADEPRRTSWGAWASILAFPAVGLSVYVMLDDVLIAKATSLSTLLVLGIGIALCVMGIVRGIATAALRRNVLSVVGFGALAILVGTLLYGAGANRLDAREIEIAREAQPAQLRWSRFALDVPRVGAAHLGEETAPHEVLVVVDPSDEASRGLMKAAAALGPTLGSQIAIYFYAPSDPGLLAAFHAGKLKDYLEDPASFPRAAGALPQGFERQNAALTKIGVAQYPTALWQGGRQSGAIDLREVISSLGGRAAR